MGIKRVGYTATLKLLWRVGTNHYKAEVYVITTAAPHPPKKRKKIRKLTLLDVSLLHMFWEVLEFFKCCVFFYVHKKIVLTLVTILLH